MLFGIWYRRKTALASYGMYMRLTKGGRIKYI